MNISAEFFRTLGDPLRLRVLRLLSIEKLNVSELTGILGVAQSGVSRHLRLLRQIGLVQEEREAGWAYYTVDASQFTDGVSHLWPLLSEQLRSLEGCRKDDARLQEVLRQRKEEFREKSDHGICPGRSWAAWARTVSYLVPQYTVADLGCGEGYLTLEAARWAKSVTAVDTSRSMLRHARQIAKKQGARNIHFKLDDLEKLSLADETFEVALMSQVLHSVEHPLAALKEANRILKHEGKLLIQELRTHEEDWVRGKLGDRKLGFEENELKALLRDAGFVDVRLDVGSKRRGDPFTVLIGFGRKRK